MRSRSDAVIGDDGVQVVPQLHRRCVRRRLDVDGLEAQILCTAAAVVVDARDRDAEVPRSDCRTIPSSP
jgi:hypothetical protein